MTMQPDEVRAVVAEVLAEQKAAEPDIDAVVLKTLATILTSFGIEGDDRYELRADFVYLRKWRKSVDAAGELTIKIVVTMIVTGLVGALGLGIRAMLAK